MRNEAHQLLAATRKLGHLLADVEDATVNGLLGFYDDGTVGLDVKHFADSLTVAHDADIVDVLFLDILNGIHGHDLTVYDKNRLSF